MIFIHTPPLSPLDSTMLESVATAYQRLAAARPLVRPAYNQLEVTVLRPYGDPEVHIPSEVGTYLVAGVFANAVLERLFTE